LENSVPVRHCSCGGVDALSRREGIDAPGRSYTVVVCGDGVRRSRQNAFRSVGWVRRVSDVEMPLAWCCEFRKLLCDDARACHLGRQGRPWRESNAVTCAHRWAPSEVLHLYSDYICFLPGLLRVFHTRCTMDEILCVFHFSVTCPAYPFLFQHPLEDPLSSYSKPASFCRPQGTLSPSNPGRCLDLLTLRVCLQTWYYIYKYSTGR
jgi:hypothetical protein